MVSGQYLVPPSLQDEAWPVGMEQSKGSITKPSTSLSAGTQKFGQHNAPQLCAYKMQTRHKGHNQAPGTLATSYALLCAGYMRT